MKISELWHNSKDETVIQVIDAQINSGQVMVKSQYSLVSQGTEQLVTKGLVPEELHKEMKVPYMKGDFSFPCTYGYSLVGTVVQGNNTLENTLVHLLYPHANVALADSKDVYHIPASIPAERAVLASNMETVVNAIWDSSIAIGDKALICGFGMIGALLAVTLKSFPAVQLFVYEPNEFRNKLGKSLGLKMFSSEADLPNNMDIAFNCSASENGLQQCINSTMNGGTIVEMSWYGKKSVQINLGGTFHSGRKRIISSQVSRIPANKQVQWDNKRRKDLVFSLLQHPDYDKLLTQFIDFSDAPAYFNNLRQSNNAELGVVIKY